MSSIPCLWELQGEPGKQGHTQGRCPGRLSPQPCTQTPKPRSLGHTNTARLPQAPAGLESPGESGQRQAGQRVTKKQPSTQSCSPLSSRTSSFPRKGSARAACSSPWAGTASPSFTGSRTLPVVQLSALAVPPHCLHIPGVPLHTKPILLGKFFPCLLPLSTPEFRQLTPPQSYR